MKKVNLTHSSTFAIVMLLFIFSIAGITAYTVNAIRRDTVTHGYALASMHSRSFEDLITQNLHITEILAPSILQNFSNGKQLDKTESELNSALRRTPFLRSVSLLDLQGRIIASSNRENRGIQIEKKNFFPLADSNESSIFRIGIPWSGRDFANGYEVKQGQPAADNEPYFFPVLYSLLFNNTRHTMLLAINPDHFLNHVLQKLDSKEGHVEVLRYDGILLISSDQHLLPGIGRQKLLSSLNISENDSSSFELADNNGSKALCSITVSRLYPLVVATRLDLDYILRNWKNTTTTLTWSITLTLAAVCTIAALLYRRQRHLARQQESLQHIQEINATVFEASMEATLIADKDNMIISANRAFTDVTGYLPDEVIGQQLFNFLTDSSIQEFRHKFETATPGKTSHQLHAPETVEVQQYCKNGALLWMEILSTPERNKKGEITGYRRIIRSISERKLAEEQLQLTANVFSHTLEGIMIMSPDGLVIEVNNAFSQLTGYGHDEVLGQTPIILSPGPHNKEFYSSIWQELDTRGYWRGEIWSQHKNGEQLAFILTISSVTDQSGNTRQLVALINDITPLKTHQRELEQLAHFDSLTGLPNRMLLSDRLQQAITQSKRRNLTFAVVFIDLDGFKEVNDTYGHDCGDRLLVEVSRRMKHVLRIGDTLARLGGDEFVVLLIDLMNNSDNIHMLQRILLAVSQPVQIDPHILQVSASMGVTYYPQQTDLEADQLIRQADQAMYQAKMAGKNRYVVYSSQAG
jgi:diguanylate cyclase (GGDEF)-like protein/PAS domain S-box-containing protein